MEGQELSHSLSTQLEALAYLAQTSALLRAQPVHLALACRRLAPAVPGSQSNHVSHHDA